MPERTLYTLTWSTEHNAYELTLNGQLSQSFGAADEPVWFAWLATHPAFLFQGRAGSLRAYKESRSRGGDYWYAYHFTDRHLRKHYLGRNAALSFARLEEVAGMLQTIVPQPAHREHHSPTMQSNGSTVLPFLHSSFQVPLLPGTLVDRPRLLQQLDAALLHPLTLLSASAGCGKTTLLSAWAARHSQQVAWLSLESLDNDQRRFWVSVILALRACQPDVGEAALALLQSSQPTTVVAILTALLNELTALPKAMVLILDDYHVIEEEALHEALFFVLEHLPTNLHLILSTRVDPAFPLAGFRARGQMTEIRAADLRFTATETTTFLTEAMGLPLSQQQSGILEERTEGWIAGLQLTALSLQKQDDPAAFLQQLKGSHRFLLDYVQEEILQSQSMRMQRFLLHTAILTRMNAALCEAVMGELAAQTLLEEAERSNLFLVPLDEERRWYRFHALFREALLTRLRTSQPEQVPLLQRRAATWYATQGFLHEAIAHALEAKDAPYAADLIEHVIVPQSWRNEFPTLRRWLEHLPRAVLQERPWLSLTLASAITSTSPLGPGLLELVKEPLDLAERGYRMRGDQAGVGGVLTLRAIVLVYQGAFAQAHALVRQALVLLPESEEQWRMACLTLAGMEAAFAGQSDQARQLLLQSQELALATTSYIGKLGNTVLLGDVCLSRGELRQAARYLHQALTILDEQPGLTRLQITRAMGTSEAPYYEQMACYGLAALSYEWNDLQAARQYFQAARPEAFHPLLLVLTPGLLFQVRLLLACGEAQTAEVRLEELVVQERRPEILREIHLCQAYLAFRRGELAKVEQWAATSPQAAELPALSKREAEALLLARFHLAKGQPDHALDLLAPWKQEARRAQRLHSELQILALEALANEAKGARVQACDRLLQVLRLAQPENYQRLFLDEGPAMAALLQILVAERHEKELTQYMRALLHAFSQIQTGQERSPSSRAFLADGSVLFMEPLTTRELEVLRFLMEGAPNQEIADQLVIALATVKKHVSNVLSKLGARNRVEAIARARNQHLFE